MQKSYVGSLGLPKGFSIEQYETLAEIQADTKSDALIVDIVNKYCRQKDCLVDGRDKLAEMVNAKTGFAWVTKTVTSKDKDGVESTSEEIDETEGKYLSRFVEAIVAGDFSSQDFPVSGDTVEAKTASVNEGLQRYADSIPLRVNAFTPERTKKDKQAGKLALAAADNIIKNSSQDKWSKTFKKCGIQHEDFMTSDPEVNRQRLARAVAAHKAWRDANE